LNPIEFQLIPQSGERELQLLKDTETDQLSRGFSHEDRIAAAVVQLSFNVVLNGHTMETKIES
jgi:sortase (surface protein transpeptidase)